jgi:hypothetical protein
MTEEQVVAANKKYLPLVEGKLISKDLKGHIIRALAVKLISPGDYELYVLAQDLSHAIPYLNYPLFKWMDEHGIVYD